jgi:hypothetical protein
MRFRRACWSSAAALAVAVLVVLPSACSGDPSEIDQEVGIETEAASPEPLTPTHSPTPTEQPTAEGTPDPEPDRAPAVIDEPPPDLELTGDDYERIVNSYTTYRTWLFRHPDPELFDLITHPDCECYVQKDLLAHYQEQGLRWTGGEEGIQVHRVEVVDDQARNLVHLEVVFARPEGGQLIDAEGAVHEEVHPREPWVEELVFVREDESAPWRLRDFVERGPLEEGGDDG